MRVIDVPGHSPDAPEYISNDVVRQALEEIGIEFLVTLPESQYEDMLKNILERKTMRILQVCRETEGLSICSGLVYGGKKTAMICSFKGLYNSIDSLLGTAVRTESSFLILLSESAGQAKRFLSDPEEGLFTEEILKAVKIPYRIISSNSEISIIKEAWKETQTSLKPIALILRW